jgi:hypothetical protein
MLTTVSAIVGLILSVLAVGAIIATVWARFRTTADETTTVLYKAEAEAWKARAERLEAEFATYRTEMASQVASLASRVDSLEVENRFLRSQYDYREEIAAVRTDIRNLPCQVAPSVTTIQVKTEGA